MGRNYYDVLGVAKGTSDESVIKKAYKKAALKFHPDRPGGDKVKFQEVSEAFEVLSNSNKKQIYDQCGEGGLGSGGDPSQGNSSSYWGMGGGDPGGQTYHFHMGGGGGGPGGAGAFQGSDPFSVFESIFGTMDVDQAIGSGGAPGGGGNFTSFPMGGMSGMRMGGVPMHGSEMGAMGGVPGASHSTRQAPPVEHPLKISLEELFQGSSKRMRITKKTASGEAQVDKAISIKPGWKDGTRITFEKEGDEQPGMVPADIVFVIKTKPHPTFKRERNDLLCNVNITLQQALTGFEIPVDSLDGRKIIIREPGIACSSFKSVIKGEGMPSQKDQQVRGNLIASYNVQFPPPAQTEAKNQKRRQMITDL